MTAPDERGAILAIVDPAARARAAIAAYPWPRRADHYLDHTPSLPVALAITEDLAVRVVAARAGRDPDLAMRQGWDAR